MRTNTITNAGSKRPKVKLVSGAAGLLVGGLILAACTSATGAARTTTSSQGQPSQYRQAAYPAATPQVSEQQQLRMEHRVIVAAKPKLSPVGDHELLRQRLLRQERLGR